MTVGARLREERLRLGLSQERFAQVAGVAKNTGINWEKDASSPTAAALISWMAVGADPYYVLTGERLDQQEDAATLEAKNAAIWREFDRIRSEILDPRPRRREGENEFDLDDRMLREHASQLEAILADIDPKAVSALRDEAEHLQNIVKNSSAVSAFRASHRLDKMKERQRARKSLHEAMQNHSFFLTEPTTYLLVDLIAHFRVPAEFVAIMVEQINDDLSAVPTGLESTRA